MTINGPKNHDRFTDDFAAQRLWIMTHDRLLRRDGRF